MKRNLNEVDVLQNEILELRKELAAFKEINSQHIDKESHYDDIVFNMRDTVEREDANYTLTYVNKAYCEYYGVKAEDVIGTSAMNCVVEIDQKKIERMMKRVTPKNPNYRYSCRVRNGNGDIVWVETEGRCFFDSEGNVLEYQEVGRDISRHQSLAEQAERFRLDMEEKVRERTLELVYANSSLSETNRYLQNTLNNITEGVITVDYNGKISFLNYGTNAAWSQNEKFITEKLRNELGKKGSLLYNLLHNKEGFQNNEINFPTPQKEIQCIASGAYLGENNDTEEIMLILQPLAEVRHLVNTMSGANARFSFKDIIGKSAIIKDAISFAKKIADSEGNVIIEGESGTGKELFAQSIHNASMRKKGPFIAVNCGAIPRDLVGSELFGYTEGSFTGAKKGGKPGKFELASGGTIFLDEIAEMPLEQQIVLLRVLQERSLMRIGGDRIIPIDVRIICATNKNLLDEVQKGNFRQDLYYRLNVINLHIPSLRQHKEDIAELFHHFIEQKDKEGIYQDCDFTHSCIELLEEYDWPGNVRELQNITERMFYLANGGPLVPQLLPSNIFSQVKPKKEESSVENSAEIDSQYYRKYLKELEEKEQITELMKKHHYNMTKIAKEMKISRATLYRKVEKYQIK